MPGPRNQKKKKPTQNKKGRKPPPSDQFKSLDSEHDQDASNRTGTALQQTEHADHAPSPTPALALASTPAIPSPPPLDVSVNVVHETVPYEHYPEPCRQFEELAIYPQSQCLTYPPYSPYPEEPVDESPIPLSLLKTPFIHDPGSGPRVKDIRAFLASRLASPPSLDDPLCVEFADEAVLQMLCTVLPEETATILWFNKSRVTARICPACQRLYRLGDVLPHHLTGEDGREAADTSPSPFLAKEQELSGLCSPVCFILASYNYPGAIRSTWGRMAEELDDATWDLLDGPGQRANDMGLGMLLKMTRCHDLGLGQLFFPDLEFDSDETANEGDEEVQVDAKWAGDGVEKDVPVNADQVREGGVVEVMERLRLEDTAPVLGLVS